MTPPSAKTGSVWRSTMPCAQAPPQLVNGAFNGAKTWRKSPAEGAVAPFLPNGRRMAHHPLTRSRLSAHLLAHFIGAMAHHGGVK